MSKSFKNNPVNVYFNNLRKYIDTNNVTGGVEFLKEIKSELLYLLLKNGQSIDSNKKLSKLFIQRCNDSINYCNLLERKIILNESHNSRYSDPTYKQMVDYIKGVFGDDVDEVDLNGGIYYFASHYHGGQFSNLYRAIHQSQYKPGTMERDPVDFTNYEYTYLLYNIKYDIDADDDNDSYDDGYNDDDDGEVVEDLPESMKFVIKKDELMQDDNSRGDIDINDLEEQMTEYMSEVTGYLVKNYEYRLISSKIVEGDNATMNAVYRALINKFASVKFDVGGKHDELPPGEHYDLPPGIKEIKTNMNENTISIREVKNLINEVIAETLQQEIGAVDYNDHEPIASKDDFAGDHLNDLTDTVNRLIKQVETESGDYDKAYDRLVKIYKQLTNAIDNPRLSKIEKEKLEHDYEGLLGNIHRIIGGGGGSEKMYIAENDLTECGSWKEAVTHPMFKEAVLTEKAPPGYDEETMNKIKTSLKKAHPDWSVKKIIAMAFAIAWKMFYKNKNK